MLIETITFDIQNFDNSTAESFVVENTEINYEMICAHSFTRQIKFTKMFAFQYAKEMRMPLEFIEMKTWVAMVSAYPELVATVADLALSEV